MEASSNKKLKTSLLRTSLCIGIDRIGRLPDVLLQHILSFLPTNRSVQTCILSKRWRHLWTAVPTLDFDIDDFSSDASLENFIVNVLSLRDNKFNVVNLRVIWPWSTNTKVITSLMRYESNYMVEFLEIDYWRPIDAIFVENQSLCGSLSGLKLTRGGIEGPMGLVGFARLRSLHVCDVWVKVHLHDLLLGCPMLEELVMINCYFHSYSINSSKLKKLVLHGCSLSSQDEKIEVSCTNLVSLSYDNASVKCSLENLRSLVAAFFWVYNERIDFLSSLCNVKVLELDAIHLEVIYRETLSGSLPTFQNLKSLTIRSCPISTKAHVRGIVSLLLCSPLLEILVIDRSSYHLSKCKYVRLQGGWAPSESFIECFSYLKVVKLLNFGSSNAATEFLKFLSQNARVLKKITISIG